MRGLFWILIPFPALGAFVSWWFPLRPSRLRGLIFGCRLLPHCSSAAPRDKDKLTICDLLDDQETLGNSSLALFVLASLT